MREIEVDDYTALSQQAAELILGELRGKKSLLLCASAGGTPAGTYARLAQLQSKKPQWFAQMRVVQIDEWAGLEPRSPATCRADLEAKLLKPAGISGRRFTGFNTDAADPEAECRRMARWLEKNGPIDVCILGLGTNGHVAMNEPSDALVPGVHVAALARSSQQHPLLKSLPHKPRSGMTLGMGDILKSRTIFLLVSGSRKREALKRMLRPSITPRIPASLLWLHPRATVLYDRAAGSGL